MGGHCSIRKSPCLACGSCGLEERGWLGAGYNSLLRQRAKEGNSPVDDPAALSRRFERLHQLYDVKVAARNVWMFSCVVVFLSNHNSLFEEVFRDESSIFLWDKHDRRAKEKKSPM